MSTLPLTPAAPTTMDRSALGTLAWLEVRRYARHPMFLVGLAITLAAVVSAIVAGSSESTSTVVDGIAPAAALGLFGIVTTAALTRKSDTLHTAAGAAPVPERTRTMALLIACLLPFSIGVAWWVWAYLTYLGDTIPANGYPFGPVSDAWVGAVMFGQGAMPCLGGPVLGIVIARWSRHRAAPALTAVGVLAFCIALQGLIEPLRGIHTIAPFTHWGGPFGVDGDPERMLILTGSPYWWVLYLVCLCALGAIAALLHDPEGPRAQLWRAAGVVGAVAVIALILSMVTGIGDTLVNPLQSSL